MLCLSLRTLVDWLCSLPLFLHQVHIGLHLLQSFTQGAQLGLLLVQNLGKLGVVAWDPGGGLQLVRDYWGPGVVGGRAAVLVIKRMGRHGSLWFIHSFMDKRMGRLGPLV